VVLQGFLYYVPSDCLGFYFVVFFAFVSCSGVVECFVFVIRLPPLCALHRGCWYYWWTTSSSCHSLGVYPEDLLTEGTDVVDSSSLVSRLLACGASLSPTSPDFLCTLIGTFVSTVAVESQTDKGLIGCS